MIKKINYKNIILFTLPTIFMMLFLAFYTMVDGMFVSNFVSEEALSAVNIVYPLFSIILAVGLMFGTGGNAIIAKLLGEGKKTDAKQKFSLFTITSFIVGVILAVLTFLNLEFFINVLGANNETYNYAYDYMKILILFFPCIVAAVIFQNAYVACGKPILSLVTMLLGGITNIILDYVFLVPLDMGIFGVGLATGIGYFLQILCGIIYFSSNKRVLHFVKPKLDFKSIGHASVNGSSEMVSNIAIAITTFLFNMAIFNLVGNQGIAAITVILYSHLLLNSVFLGYSMGIAPVISYNYGEQNKSNLRKIYLTSIKLILIVSIFTTICAFFLAGPITELFTDKSSEMYSLTIEGLKIFSISFIFAGINIFTSALFTAYSNGKISAFISFLRTLVLITISLLTLPKFFGVVGVWLAIPVAEAITIIVSVYLLNKYKSKYMYNKEVYKPKEIKHKIITVEREFASGGREVAKRLADELGYQYYDEEIINKIAKTHNLDKDFIEKNSEYSYIRKYPITYARSFTTYKEDLNLKILATQSKIIKELANKGNAIFVGRTAGHILEDFNPYKIFVFATDDNFKINRCHAKGNNETDLEIRKMIKKIDRERVKYFKHHTGLDRNDLSHYDFIIDTSILGIKDSVKEILKYYN